MKARDYYGGVFRRAFSDARNTGRDFGLWAALVFAAIGFLVFFLWKGWDEASTQAFGIVASVLVPVAAIASLAFLFHLVRAPWNLAEESRERLSAVEEELARTRAEAVDEARLKAELRRLYRTGFAILQQLERRPLFTSPMVHAWIMHQRLERWHREAHHVVDEHFPERLDRFAREEPVSRLLRGQLARTPSDTEMANEMRGYLAELRSLIDSLE